MSGNDWRAGAGVSLESENVTSEEEEAEVSAEMASLEELQTCQN